MTAAHLPPRPRLPALLALNVLVGSSSGVLQLVLPLQALALGATGAQVGLLRALGGAGMLILVLPVGLLIDRLGPPRVLRTGLVAGAALTLLMARAPGPAALMALAALDGCTGPLRFTSLHAGFLAHLPALGPGRAGWLKGSISVGLTFAGPLAGGLLAQAAGLPAGFGAAAALLLAAVALAGQLGPAAPPAGPRCPPAPGALRAITGVVGDRALWPLLGIELLSAATFTGFSAFLVVRVVQALRGDAATASVLLAIEGTTFVLSAFAGGRLASSPVLLRRAAGLLNVAGLTGTALARDAAGLGAASAVLGLGLGLLPVLVACGLARHPGARGRVAGAVQAAAGLGFVLGPLAAAAAATLAPGAALLVFVPAHAALAWPARGARPGVAPAPPQQPAPLEQNPA
ncbi:MAG: MFS transporter [Anaeromyxobacter sp.]